MLRVTLKEFAAVADETEFYPWGSVNYFYDDTEEFRVMVAVSKESGHHLLYEWEYGPQYRGLRAYFDAGEMYMPRELVERVENALRILNPPRIER